MIEIKNNNENNEIKVYNVMPVYKGSKIDSFNTVVNGKDIVNSYNYLIYDGEAQRGYIETTKGKAPMINKKHIKNIKEAILHNESIGTLIWNIRIENNKQNYKYDAINHVLTINNAKITLPDSAHRHKALYEISQEDENSKALNNEYVLNIYNRNFEEEKDLFEQINGKQKKTSNNRNKFFSKDIKKELLKEAIYNSALNGRVDFVNNVTSKTKLTKFSTICDSSFDTNSAAYKNEKITKENYSKYLKWYISFYNELLTTRSEFNFSNKREEKKKTMLLEEISWWGFHTIMKSLYGDKHWKRRLHNIMNKKIIKTDFWAKENKIWTRIRRADANIDTKEIVLTPTIENNSQTRTFVANTVQLYLLQ